jgi:hypothetical protein
MHSLIQIDFDIYLVVLVNSEIELTDAENFEIVP